MKLRAVCAALAGVGLFAFASSSSAAQGVVALTQAAYQVDESAGSLTVTVRRTGDLSGSGSVRYAAGGNGTSAQAGSDFGAVSGTLAWVAGESDKTFVVPILQDAASEADESFGLTLSAPSGVSLGSVSAAQALIRDDDAVQFSLLSDFTSSESAGTAAVTVQRLGRQTAAAASVNFTVGSGSATAGSDFVPTSGTLSWSPGDPSGKVFAVSIINDTAVEPDEWARLSLSSPVGGTLGRSLGKLILVSDDFPAASALDAQADEGDNGGSNVTITVTLDQAAGAPATVRFSLVADSAAANVDFEAQSGTLTFAAGETQKTVVARVIGDTVKEGTEVFKLVLSAPERMTLARATASVSIRDNDNPANADAQLAAPALEASLRGCDVLDVAHCLFPFPSDQFTTAAAPQSVQSSARGGTGRRINFNILAMPRNAAGKPIDPTEWNRNDGYSPGQLITTYVNGLSLERTFGTASADVGIANLALSQTGVGNPRPAIMVLEVPQPPEVFTPREQLVWSEIDANANLLVQPEGNAVAQPTGGQAALLIRPAKNFREGRRYVVVLRGLRNAQGLPIAAADAFKVCRDRAGSMLSSLSARCNDLESKVFPVLDAAGVVRDASLYLAWDFTVGSTENQIGRIRRMRDDAFAALSSDPARDNCTQYRDGAPCRAPGFIVDKVTDTPQTGIARRIEGSITVPSYLVPSDASPLDDTATHGLLQQLVAMFPGQFGELSDVLALGGGASAPPNRLFYNPSDSPNPGDPAGQLYGDGLPDRAPGAGLMTTRFMCQIPAQASPQQPARAGVYGHGLLDSRAAVTYDGVPDLSREFNYMFCAVDWYGFATGDLPNVASTLVDLSNFPVVPDASQQGILNFAYLARLLRDAHGFAAHPAFQQNGLPVFDRSEVFYDGNSQGGILGGAVLALSKDVNRGALGSLGMNYSTLLSRSVDFDLYAVPLYLAYQNPLDRDLAFSLIQMLWDRSENNGYAAHIVDNAAFQGPANAAKLDPQFGDHQVTMWSADVMARTMGIPVDSAQTARVAALKGQTRRHPDLRPHFAMPVLDYANPQQAAGGALVMWDDSRTAIPPITNTPPRAGRDPHDDSAKKFSGRCQKAHFLRTGGQLVNVTPVEFDGAACPAVASAPPTTAVGTLQGDQHAEPHFPLCANGVCVADIPLVGETLAGALIHSLIDTLCSYYWVEAICAAAVVEPGTASGGTLLQHYVGAMHEHSSYSDGNAQAIPRDYFNAARSAGLDFLMSSEHADNEKLPITTSADCIQFFTQLPSGTLNPVDATRLADCSKVTEGEHYHKWGATLAQALEASTESFTGVRGFEWTNDFHGHLNVYFSSNVTNAKNDGGYTDMVRFWSWLQKAPEQGGGADALVTFNHPGRNPSLSPFDSGFNGLVPPASVENWNDFEYINAAVDQRVFGMELHSEGYIDDYVRALSKGWHVGAVGAEDEHGTRWAASDQPKTVIIAPSRSRADLKAALQARHQYVVYGSRNDVRLGFAASAPGCVQESAIQGDRIDCSARAAGSSTPVRFSGLATGLTGATVELRSAGVDSAGRQPADIANTGAVVFGPAASLGGAVVNVDDQFIGERWYFVVAKDPAGRVIAVSSPIWVKGYRFGPAPQPLLAGIAKGAIRVPVGTPLGGYLRPPVGGDYLPGLEGFAEGDPSAFFTEFLDFLPTEQDHDGVPLAPLPDELRKLHSPYATFSAPSRGYYDSLVTKAVALYDGHDYVVMVKTDFIGMLDELVQGVTAKVKADTGIDLGDGLIMSATHTHDGPGAVANHSTRYFWLAMDAYQPELYDRLVPQLAEVVKRSLADLQPARFGARIGTEGYQHPTEGFKNLNSFRRDRLPSYDRAANDAMRSRLGVMRVDTAAGEPLAVIINFAAHGIAFDVENQYFSGDVLGAIERESESLLNLPLAMLVQNTGGDVSPRADGAPTLQRIERFGKILAPQVKKLYDSIGSFATAPDLRAVSQRVILSRERLGYTGTEYPYPWGAAQCNNEVGVPFAGPGTGGTNPGCLAGPPPDAIDLADNGVGENGAFLPQDTRLTAASIGGILLLAQPGEPLAEYGVRLLKLATDNGFAAGNTFIWGYAQDHVGYIVAPEEADWAMGGTEGTTTFWGWRQGQRLLDANVGLMQALRQNLPAPEDEFQANYFYQDLYALAPKAPVTPSLRAGRVVTQPTAIQRFQQTVFTWEGGDPVVDSPVATLERMDAAGLWQPARRPNGEVINTYFEMHLKYRLVSGAHLWTVEFEAPMDWLTGSYRFNVSGVARMAADAPYVLQSQAFAVSPSPTLQLSAPTVVNGQTVVTMAYTPRPGNYRLIDALVRPELSAPVRLGVVSFTNANSTVLATKPTLEVRSGQLVAVYRAKLTGVNRISGADIYGNTTPGAVPPPGNATVDNGTGVIRIVADLFSGLGEVASSALSGDLARAATQLQQLIGVLTADVASLIGGNNASLIALFGNAAANLANGDPQAMLTQAGADAGAVIGLDADPVTVARRAGGADRAAAAVVLLGAQLPGWSQPSAQGSPYPYPSGATTTGAGPAPFDDRRDAHNGVMAYPAGWTPGTASSSLPTAVPSGEIAAYARRGTAWIEIPVQVDERYPFFLANGHSDFSVYSGTDEELTYAWDTENWNAANSADGCSAVSPRGVPDPIAGLDDDDEVTFMWSDAGEIATPGTAAPAGAVGGMRQVALLDPLNPSSLRFVYLVRKPGGSTFDQQHYVRYQRDANADQWIDRNFFADSDPQKLGSSNTGYGPNLPGTVCQNGVKRQSNDRFPRDGLTVQTDAYRWTATGRWMVRGMQIAKPGKPGVYGPDLVDRWKGRAFQQSPDSNISVVGFEDEQVNWEANSGLLGERCGPVRCMREVWGADSGTNVTKTETFYRDAVAYRYHVRVHPIPPDGLYTAWDYNRSAMVPGVGESVPAGRYYTVLRPQGVPIDGFNDDLGQADSISPIPMPNGPLCLSPEGPVEPGPNGLCRAFFDAADPTFNLALAFDNWEQVSGKGDSGSLVYTFEMKGATSLANPLVVPYYRDDACLDDGTGDDPVQRPWPGESYTWNNGAVGKAYDAMAGRPLDYSGHVRADCEQRQGAYGAHGVHFFVTHDSDNAFILGKPNTEIDGQQWQFAVPTSRPVNVGELYSNNVRAPIVPLVTVTGAP